MIIGAVLEQYRVSCIIIGSMLLQCRVSCIIIGEMLKQGRVSGYNFWDNVGILLILLKEYYG